MAFWQEAIRTRYRVWYSRNGEMRYGSVNSPEEGKRVIVAQALADLKDDSVAVNVFGLEEHEDDGWHEWYDEEGNDIDHMVDAALAVA